MVCVLHEWEELGKPRPPHALAWNGAVCLAASVVPGADSPPSSLGGQWARLSMAVQLHRHACRYEGGMGTACRPTRCSVPDPPHQEAAQRLVSKPAHAQVPHQRVQVMRMFTAANGCDRAGRVHTLEEQHVGGVGAQVADSLDQGARGRREALDVGQQPGPGVPQVPQQLQGQQDSPQASLGQYGQVLGCQGLQGPEAVGQKPCTAQRVAEVGGGLKKDVDGVDDELVRIEDRMGQLGQCRRPCGMVVTFAEWQQTGGWLLPLLGMCSSYCHPLSDRAWSMAAVGIEGMAIISIVYSEQGRCAVRMQRHCMLSIGTRAESTDFRAELMQIEGCNATATILLMHSLRPGTDTQPAIIQAFWAEQ